MRRPAMLLLLAMLLLAVGFGLGTYTGGRLKEIIDPSEGDHPPSRGTAPKPAGLGRVQPRGGIISIGGVPGDRVSRLHVLPNDRFTKDKVLVEFASRAERGHEWELAKMQIVEAKARLAKIDVSEKAKLAELDQQEIKATSATALKISLDEIQIPSLREGLRLATDILEGLRTLDPARATVALQDMQKAKSEEAAAKSRYEAAQASREAAKKQLKLDREALEVSRAAVRAEFGVSRAAVALPVLQEQAKLAELRYQRAEIKADFDGVVLRVLAREGATVGQEPILQLAATDKLDVLAEVYVDSIHVLNDWLKKKGVVQAKMTATGALPGIALNGTLKNTEAIDPIVARNTLVGFGPRAESDRRIIDVRIELDEESSKQVAKYIGLEVNVEFLEP